MEYDYISMIQIHALDIHIHKSYLDLYQEKSSCFNSLRPSDAYMRQ